MIRGIHHISLKCGTEEERARVEDFYVRTLGLSVVREWDGGLLLDTGGGLIEVFCTGDGVREKGAIRHVALAADGVDETAEKVRAAGYEVFVAPRDIDVPCPARMAFCRGPLGEEIELFCERKGSAAP